MSLRIFPAIIFCLLYPFYAMTQPFGGNPPSVKWKQIDSNNARIIFPSGLENQAEQVFSIVQALSRSTLPTIGRQQRKINIVFQAQTTVANGYVQLAPFRSEFQLTADQNSFELGSLPWQQQLAIHEYRHVQQYSNFRVGLSKVFYYLFGEGGQELANNLSVPNWFWEGDAVYQETLVSRQGRGRLPGFFDSYRALWTDQKKYSWMKLRNGSLRDYVPDHYPLGYMLVAYGREKYGPMFWKEVAHDAAAFRGLFYPLQQGIARYSGKSFTAFRDDALEYFRQQAADSSGRKPPVGGHFRADEEFPQFTGDGRIIYMRTSYRQAPAFMIRNRMGQDEKKIKTRSISLDNYFSYRNGKIVYAAYEPDTRWGWRDFNVLRVLDVLTGMDKRITTRSKYFSPDISADGQRIVAVEAAENGTTTLHILNSQTGVVEQIVPNPQDLYYTYPKFYNKQKLISAVRNQHGQMALASIDIQTGETEWLTPFSMHVIGFPSVTGDTVYFSAAMQGRDRLFAAASHKVYQLRAPKLNSSTGNYQLQANEGRYLWTNFTAGGYTMHSASRSDLSFMVFPDEQWNSPLSTQGIGSLENGPAGLLDSIRFGSYPIKKYPASFEIFHFHSWRPYLDDPDYSFDLVSDNILNSLETDLFIGYNRNERYKQAGIDATYGGLFPLIDFGMNYTFDRNAFYRGQKVYWNEAQGRIGMTVPLNLSKGRSSTSLRFGSDIIYNQRYFEGIFKDSFDRRGFAYIDPNLSFLHESQMAHQQIFPSFAQSVSLQYNRVISTLKGNQLTASGYFYFPGLTSTHSLELAAAVQQRDSLDQVSFSNSFPFSRGYSGENFYRMWRLGANYHFPVAYPDWGFGDIVYFLRVRANLFFDYTRVPYFPFNGPGVSPQYRSFGTEIYFDTKWWNELPVSFGFRYSRLMDPDYEGRGPNQWEFILPLNLLSQ